MSGYSDPINHALAFAAKHHDQQVRRGTRLPYLTPAPNIAIILTRYERDDATVVTGILHDSVEDFVRDGYSAEMLEARIGEKFGHDVLDVLLDVVPRRMDDEGTELSRDERRDDLLKRLEHADERALWVIAADLVHDAGRLLADLSRTEFPESVWGRHPAGRAETVQWFRRVHDQLAHAGFAAPIMQELGEMVTALEQLAP